MVRFFFIILLIFLSIFSIEQEVSANGTSFYQHPSTPTANVLPMKEGEVSIEREDLWIRFEKQEEGTVWAPANPSITANVRVTYNLYNHLKKDVTIPIAFPQPGNSNSWEIELDGNAVELTGLVSLPSKDLIGRTKQKEWIHPRSGESYLLRHRESYVDSDKLDAKTFSVTLKGQSQHELQVEYRIRLGMDERTNLHPVYRFDYLLHPASYWSEFDDLHITVEIPFHAETEMSLPLEQNSYEHIWTKSFDSLPKDDLIMFISPNLGPFANLFQSRGKALITLFIILSLYYPVCHFVIKRSNPIYRKYIPILFFIIFSLIGYDLMKEKLIGYPFNFFQPYLFCLYVLLLLTFSLRVMKGKRE